MLQIFFTVKKIFDDTFKNESAEFKEGFRKCFTFFEIGYEKTIQTPLAKDYRKVVNERDDLSRQLANQRKRYEKKLTELQIENMILAEKFKRLVARTDEPDEMRKAG